jgi:hypothetical protein
MRPLLVFKHSYRMDEFQLQERTDLAMDGQLCRGLWNGVSSPHYQESPDTRHRVWFGLFCYEVLSFCFLTLFWFYCLCCFMGRLTVYKILKFGLVYYVIFSFDYASTH